MVYKTVFCPRCGSNEGIRFISHMYDLTKPGTINTEKSILRYSEYLCVYCVLNFGFPEEIKGYYSY